MTEKEHRFEKQSQNNTENLPLRGKPGESNTLVIEDETLRKGFTTIPNYILDDHTLSVGAKFTYILLLSFAWQEGSCFPGQKRLAEKLGLKERMVRYYLSELETRTWIAVKQRGLGKTNLYLIKKRSHEAERQPVASLNRQSFSHPKWQRVADKQNTVQEHTGEEDSDHSKFRKGRTLSKNDMYRPKQSFSAARAITVPHSQQPTSNGHSLGKIAQVLTSLSRGKLHDPAHAKSNITRALNLWRASHLTETEFIALIYEAFKLTLKRTGSIRKRADHYMGLRNHAPYFFQVLQDLSQRQSVSQFRAKFSARPFLSPKT